MKTRAEVEALKRKWIADPCWDIEGTEGFDEYRAELRDFRLRQEDAWAKREQARLEERAALLGCTVPLIRELERIERLINHVRSGRDWMI